MDDLPFSAAEARASGAKFYFTGRPCKRGHVAKRYAHSNNCAECMVGLRLKHYEENREVFNERAKAWNDAHPEVRKATIRKYDQSHKGRAKREEWWKEYYPANKHKFLAHTRLRQTRKQMATPPWYDHDEVLAIYAEAKRLTEGTGVKHHVDHVIPLKHELVCGLHVQGNLQILSARSNQVKGNKFDPA